MEMNLTTETRVAGAQIDLSNREVLNLERLDNLFEKLAATFDYNDDLMNPITGEVIEAREFSRMRGIIGCLLEANEENVIFSVKRKNSYD